MPGEGSVVRGVVVGAVLTLLLATSAAETPVSTPTLTGGAAAQDVPSPEALSGPDHVPPPLSQAQEDDLLSRQRAMAAEASTTVGHSVALLEDEHFIFLSDLPASSRKEVMGWLGGLYHNLDGIFAAGAEGMRMWDGKLVVAAFCRRADYLAFALAIQEQRSAVFAGGYFQPGSDPTTGGMTATVVVPLPEGQPDALPRLRSVLVHECTHAFLYYWERPGRTPLWLHEGTAVHMQAVADPEDPQVRALRRRAKKAASREDGYPITFATEGLMPQSGSDILGYSQALAMTETLLAADAMDYVRFIRLMKEDAPQKEALAQAFTWSYDTLDANWRSYARTEY